MSPRPGTASHETLELDQCAIRVKDGDSDAARALFNGLWPKCVQHGREYLRCTTDVRFDIDAAAEDIAAQTLEAAFKHIREYDPAKASVLTWVKMFVTNAACDFIRKACTRRERLASSGPEDDDEGDPMERLAACDPSDDDRLIQREAANEILDVLFRLKNAHYRDWLIVHSLLAMPYGAIAKFGGVSETAVRSTISRALAAFEQDFRAKLPHYQDADIDELARLLKDGVLSVTEEQINRLPAEAARAVRACARPRRGHTKETDMNSQIRIAISALVKAKPRRAARPMDVERFGRLLSAAGTALLGGAAQAESLGDRLARAAARGSADKLARALGIDIHRLNALFNNAVPEELAGKPAFVAALAKALGVTQATVRSLLATARPPAIAGVIRSSSPRRAAALRRVLAITAGYGHARPR